MAIGRIDLPRLYFITIASTAKTGLVGKVRSKAGQAESAFAGQNPGGNPR
jgi:hypothetical protein